MLIQDLQHIEDVDCANEINGKGLFALWAEVGGNLGSASASSTALGANTYTDSGATVEILQGLGSSSESYAFGWAI